MDIMEMQIKFSLRFHPTPDRIAILITWIWWYTLVIPENSGAERGGSESQKSQGYKV